ncbi:hypothetical protein ANO11243_009430 [Dothideomycetidae sp. 11243]|nr:hypothetical protein ANO11243_009430 [fungal sp. No.11243]
MALSVSAAATITPLPSAVATHIQSTITITTLIDVVVGLIENSLEAHAANIVVSIDFDRRVCTVKDDGHGIHSSNFAEGGGLCRPHHTSKPNASPADDLGYGCGHGVFLACLASLSLLSITSKHVEHHSVNSLLVHRGSLLSRRNPDRRLTGSLSSDGSGTVVNVRDVFGNVPVRVKHLATTMQGRSHLSKEWAELRSRLASLLLAWPYRVSLTVEDEQDSNQRIHLRELGNRDFLKHPRSRHRLHEKLSMHAQLRRMPAILAACRLSPPALASSTVPVSAKTSALAVKGVISTVPHPTTEMQFISIDSRPISRQSDGRVLYDAINNAFAKSTFGYQQDSFDEADGRRSLRLKDIRAKKKGLDRWPCFCLVLESQTPAAMSFGPVPSSYAATCKLLSALADGWLRATGFSPKLKRVVDDVSALLSVVPASYTPTPPLPASGDIDEGEAQQQPKEFELSQLLKRPRLARFTSSDAISPFASWSRVKSSAPGLKHSIWATRTNREPVFSEKESAKASAIDLQADSICCQPAASIEDCCGECFIWASPTSGVLSRISRRTGAIMKGDHHREQSHGVCPMTPDPQSRSVDTLARDSGQHSNASKGWLSHVLESWQNPVFPQKLYMKDSASTSNHDPILKDVHGDSLSNVQVTRADLATATVIGQVDQKYVLLRVEQKTQLRKSMMVLIDQHAASERCILESLYATMMGSNAGVVELGTNDTTAEAYTERLARPMKFQVTGAEHELLRQRADHFALWGILVELEAATAKRRDAVTQNERALIVTHLPTAFSERCVQEPRLLIELIREELYNPRHRTIPSRVPDPNSPLWLTRIGSCPKGILDLLSSRACRSAIMFNDELSHEECEKLVSDLAKCVFPFTCAHGRVSMVPLVTMEGDNTNDRPPGSCFAQMFNAWQDISP